MQTLDIPGNYLTPSFGHARVRDAMRPLLLTCKGSDPLRKVAATMAGDRVHCVLVLREHLDEDEGGISLAPWAIVSDLDLVRAAERIDELTAGDIADTRAWTIAADRPLAEAAARMIECRDRHLVVVDPDDGRPMGMLSTLDLAGILAWGRG